MQPVLGADVGVEPVQVVGVEHLAGEETRSAVHSSMPQVLQLGSGGRQVVRLVPWRLR